MSYSVEYVSTPLEDAKDCQQFGKLTFLESNSFPSLLEQKLMKYLKYYLDLDNGNYCQDKSKFRAVGRCWKFQLPK